MQPPVDVPERYLHQDVAQRIALVAASFARMIGRPLVADDGDLVGALWSAPVAIVAHGIEEDPLFFFGNRQALIAFETDVDSFTGMPSRLSAEAPLRAERQALLDRVASQGFIDDYAGTRIAATGRRFRVEGAIVWNLLDEQGIRHGQAATFAL